MRRIYTTVMTEGNDFSKRPPLEEAAIVGRALEVEVPAVLVAKFAVSEPAKAETLTK